MRTLSKDRSTAPAMGSIEDAFEIFDCVGRDTYAHASLVHRFGSELYQLRVAAGLKPADLARLSGLTRGYYSQLENSKRPPPPSQTVGRLCSALNLPVTLVERLQYLAYAERVVALPGVAPAQLAKIVCCLAEKVYSSSPVQMKQVYKAIEEAIAM